MKNMKDYKDSSFLIVVGALINVIRAIETNTVAFIKNKTLLQDLPNQKLFMNSQFFQFVTISSTEAATLKMSLALPVFVVGTDIICLSVVGKLLAKSFGLTGWV